MCDPRLLPILIYERAMKENEEFTRGGLNHKAPFPGHSLEGMTYNIYISLSLIHTQSHTLIHTLTQIHTHTHIYIYPIIYT